MFCTQCGQPLEADMRFCNNCGERVEEELAQGEEILSQPPTVQKNRKSKLKIVAIVLGIIAVSGWLVTINVPLPRNNTPVIIFRGNENTLVHGYFTGNAIIRSGQIVRGSGVFEVRNDQRNSNGETIAHDGMMIRSDYWYHGEVIGRGISTAYRVFTSEYDMFHGEFINNVKHEGSFSTSNPNRFRISASVSNGRLQGYATVTWAPNQSYAPRLFTPMGWSELGSRDTSQSSVNRMFNDLSRGIDWLSSDAVEATAEIPLDGNGLLDYSNVRVIFNRPRHFEGANEYVEFNGSLQSQWFGEWRPNLLPRSGTLDFTSIYVGARSSLTYTGDFHIKGQGQSFFPAPSAGRLTDGILTFDGSFAYGSPTQGTVHFPSGHHVARYWGGARLGWGTENYLWWRYHNGDIFEGNLTSGGTGMFSPANARNYYARVSRLSNNNWQFDEIRR